MAINQHPNFGHTVFYAYIISVNGVEVGSIQKLNIRGERDTERIGEVKYDANGLQWKELLWGYESVTLDLSHIEFYKTSLLQALGKSSDFVSLAKFNFAFSINELQFGHAALGVDPTGATANKGNTGAAPDANATILRTIIYENCVPKSYSKAIDRGTIHVAEEMTVECTNVKLGPAVST